MAETVLNQQESKLDLSVDSRRQNARLKRIIGIILSVVMIALTAYVLNLQNQNSDIFSRSSDLALTAGGHQAANYRSYVQRYKETKIQLEETTRKLEEVNHQLDQVTAELTATKGMLSQTQGMLAQAQDENMKIKQELQGLEGLNSEENVKTVSELQAKIKNLREKDEQVSTELVDLKNQMRAFEGNFSNLGEGKEVIALFQNKIRLVKHRMRYLKQEAYFAKIAAQKERNRLAAINGNSGFIVRDGVFQKPDSGNKPFVIDVKIVQ